MLEKIIIIALSVMFVWSCFQEGMIFGSIRAKLPLKDSIGKPLFDCSICMTPYWGTLFYWLIWGESPKEWIIVIFAAAGLNAVFVKLFNPYN